MLLASQSFADKQNTYKTQVRSGPISPLLGDSSSLKPISEHNNILELTGHMAARINPGEVILRWRAPGDDRNTGQAAGYDVRYRLARLGPINSEVAWSKSTPATGEPSPAPTNHPDSMIVRGLGYGEVYYFCMKTFDESHNYSILSNSPLVAASDTSSDTSDFVPGDANGDGICRGSDILYLVAYLQGEVPSPTPQLAGDANGDCVVSLSDVTYLVIYFKGFGNPPLRGDCSLLLKLAIKTSPK